MKYIKLFEEQSSKINYRGFWFTPQNDGEGKRFIYIDKETANKLKKHVDFYKLKEVDRKIYIDKDGNALTSD